MIWSFVLAAVGIAGIYLAGRKSKWGWGLGLAAQVLWVVFALTTAQYGFILTAVAYGAVYGKNLWQWHQEDSQRKEASRRHAEGVAGPLSDSEKVAVQDWLADKRLERSTLEECDLTEDDKKRYSKK